MQRRCSESTNTELEKLLREVLSLNPKCGEIGAGKIMHILELAENVRRKHYE